MSLGSFLLPQLKRLMENLSLGPKFNPPPNLRRALCYEFVVYYEVTAVSFAEFSQ